MSAKHTPGPWEVTARGVTVKMGDRAYAGVDQNEGVPFAEAAANARLIAASPDLLSALEGLVGGNEELLRRYGHGLNVDSARAALAKARGDK